jgi:dTDP-4-amino-4,6-dideoxygalactose transaminase
MIPFNRPHLTGHEIRYIQEAAGRGQLAGNGFFTRRCQDWLQHTIGASRVLLTHSCTAALEMAALLLDVAPGDEVVLPSFTFVSTANAFALRGAVPVFVDIRSDTFNLDERLVEAAVTPRTRAIVPVHYAGVGCDMDALVALAARLGIAIVEDAAQGLLSTYKERALASFGRLAALSFHETKNVISGEGGALVINDGALAERAEILWEKGTDRSRFFRGQVDKYTWVDLGSSYLPGEITAAFLWAQLEEAERITAARQRLWHRYYEAAAPLEAFGIRRPVIPAECGHNAHLFYLLLPPHVARAEVLESMRARDVAALFHYVPLHASPAGRRFGRVSGSMEQTDRISDSLIRLPLWVGMRDSDPDFVVEQLTQVIATAARQGR